MKSLDANFTTDFACVYYFYISFSEKITTRIATSVWPSIWHLPHRKRLLFCRLALYLHTGVQLLILLLPTGNNAIHTAADRGPSTDTQQWFIIPNVYDTVFVFITAERQRAEDTIDTYRVGGDPSRHVFVRSWQKSLQTVNSVAQARLKH